MIRVLVAFVFAACLAAQPQDRIRIGTWNLEFFGNRRDPPRTDEDVHKVAALIVGLGVDVLAVQEIGTPEGIAQLARAAGPQWRFVLGSTGMWNDGSGGQRLGFLWRDDRVALLHAEEWLSLPRHVEDEDGRRLPIFHRVPVSAVFRARNGGIDFRAITVHLKADDRRVVERRRVDDLSLRKRIAEMEALAAALRELLAAPDEDRDIVVLGDFNHVFARERSTPRESEAKVPFDLQAAPLARWPGFRRLAPTPPRPTIRWFPESVDHVLVSEDLSIEALPDTATVHGPFAQGSPDAAALDAWHRTYSDHFPLTVDLDARRDQDPSATFRPARAGQELRPGGGSAASTPAAPVQPAQPVPPPQPAQGYFGLRPGMHVQVRLIDDRVFEGTLVSPLGPDWIEIDAGYLIAFPTRNVLSVRAK